VVRITATDDGLPESYIDGYIGCAAVGGVYYVAALTGSATPYQSCANRFSCQAQGCQHNKCTSPAQQPAGAENDVEKFIRVVLPHIAARFVLVTSLGDNRMPDDVINAAELLASPFLVRWYCQNLGTPHPKLFPMPIGYCKFESEPRRPSLIATAPCHSHRTPRD